MDNFSTDKLELAALFVNTTGVPIFLTGKAGTGKTTFLRELARRTHKKFVVLAPTGIAALNAKGVTIHSQFLLPFGTFLPVRDAEGNYTDRHGFFTQQTLARRHPLNQHRRSVLKSIDLMVIDEVSMLRADILDAIDYRMRSAKRNYKVPFGGVQVLFIGDLYQLPPVVKDEEWGVLSRFYSSMHFFEAKALQNSGLIYLELDKIFRQQDETFIRILNNLRDNKPSAEDIRILNSYYKTLDEIERLPPCITLTTHNYKADELNLRELRSLDSKSFFYDAEIEREFPESLYPLPESIELKVGARIMFIKNDTSGLSSYFNGKLATVIELESDQIKVKMDDSLEEYYLKKEVWENKKYTINPESKELEEEVIGTFSQYPIKLAWAVTVHKSQGLTFDRAIVDVGQAFAPGQVYVALSRLRSLDGLVLRTKIREDVLYSDPKVVDYTSSKGKVQNLTGDLIQAQNDYLLQLVEATFEFDSLTQSLTQFAKEHESSFEFEDEEIRKDLPKLYQIFQSEVENSEKFRVQLRALIHSKNKERLFDRVEKGTRYYLDLLERTIEILLRHQRKVENFSRIKSYYNGLEELELELFRKYASIAKSGKLIESILLNKPVTKLDEIDRVMEVMRKELLRTIEKEIPLGEGSGKKTGKRKTKGKTGKEKKEDTKEHSIRLFSEGKSPEKIAQERGYTVGTIMRHLAFGVKIGKIPLENLVDQEIISEITGVEKRLTSMKAYFEFFEGKYDYETLRLVLYSQNREDFD
ncbi:helix-turn-helix protein [Algoriphagus boseongensis]|uniref:Helix-turn-helix protein n=1 Tax=Algoriphagus boseongensis TaxID=1442587 RepID=A0A4R6T6X4_9BACT|nr:helix-turn-helix domain-containing protein [Algoriphagus boseongensis]TDQ18376.1 helix-turn-helix protein [Algoriphagus boseongensis]